MYAILGEVINDSHGVSVNDPQELDIVIKKKEARSGFGVFHSFQNPGD